MIVAFYKGTHEGISGLYNVIVRAWDRGTYSHCEVIFSDNISASASFIDGGVRFKNISYSTDNWDFVDIGNADEHSAREWFIKHQGQGYDLKGNLHFVIGFIGDSKKKWFCSEAVAASLGFKEPWRFTPNTLHAALSTMKDKDGA